MIIQQIKAQTSGNHTRLENSDLLRPIGEKSLTLEKYILILKKFYGFFYPLEQKIGQFPIGQYLPDYAQRRKAGLLKEDIIYLTNSYSPQLPLCHQLPPLNSLSEAFGCLYVMEGSTLGGKMIYNIVKDTLGLEHNKGASFFYGYGRDTGIKWKTFGQALTTVSEQYHTNTQIIESANSTFILFKNWIELE